MKLSFSLLAAIVAVGASIGGCTPSPAPEEDTNRLIVDNKQVTLSAGDVKITNARLDCGCPFALNVDGVGDTTLIRYTFEGGVISTHRVTITSAAQVPSGTHTSYIAFSTPDALKDRVFRDTLFATLVVP